MFKLIIKTCQNYIVAIPIEIWDITYRALETFKTVDAIACEDTRHTLQLLTHFGIRKLPEVLLRPE